MNASREPTLSGGGVFHSTALMFTYQSGALSGSLAYAATSARGRSMVVSLTTSTATRAPGRCGLFHQMTKALDGTVPAGRDGFEEGPSLLESSCLQRVQHLAAALLGRHQSGALQHLEVLHDGLPRDFRSVREHG